MIQRSSSPFCQDLTNGNISSRPSSVLHTLAMEHVYAPGPYRLAGNRPGSPDQSYEKAFQLQRMLIRAECQLHESLDRMDVCRRHRCEYHSVCLVYAERAYASRTAGRCKKPDYNPPYPTLGTQCARPCTESPMCTVILRGYGTKAVERRTKPCHKRVPKCASCDANIFID